MTSAFARIRDVNGVVRQVEEEGPIPVRFEELLGLDGEAVGEVLAVGGFFEARHEATVAALVGGEVTEGRAGVVAGDVDVETALLRAGVLAAEVPFTDMAGDIIRCLERRGERHLAGRHCWLMWAGAVSGRDGGTAGQPVGELRRAGYLPVIRAARVGEHTGQAA
jgi:hypothetical protein